MRISNYTDISKNPEMALRNIFYNAESPAGVQTLFSFDGRRRAGVRSHTGWRGRQSRPAGRIAGKCRTLVRQYVQYRERPEPPGAEKGEKQRDVGPQPVRPDAAWFLLTCRAVFFRACGREDGSIFLKLTDTSAVILPRAGLKTFRERSSPASDLAA